MQAARPRVSEAEYRIYAAKLSQVTGTRSMALASGHCKDSEHRSRVCSWKITFTTSCVALPRAPLPDCFPSGTHTPPAISFPVRPHSRLLAFFDTAHRAVSAMLLLPSHSHHFEELRLQLPLLLHIKLVLICPRPRQLMTDLLFIRLKCWLTSTRAKPSFRGY